MKHNNLKYMRSVVRGYSQSKLSNLTGIPQTTISCWERGIGEPTVTQAQILATALDTSINTLFSSPQRQLRDNTE